MCTVDRRDEKASRRHEADHLTHERGVDRRAARLRAAMITYHLNLAPP